MVSRAARVLAAVSLVLICVGVGVGRRPAAPAPNAEPGVAIVINGEAEATLPSVAAVWRDPGAVAEQFRSAGLIVAADPTGCCLAVGAPLVLGGEGLKADLPGMGALAACVLHHTTSEQLPLRNKGYLPMEAISGLQREALLGVVRRSGWGDKDGRPTIAEGQFTLGLWQSWSLSLCVHEGDRVTRRPMPFQWRPPTPEAVAAPPLEGSALWWVWPHAEASWGNERVTLAPDTYALGEVLKEMTRASGVTYTAPAEQLALRVRAAAEGIEVRKLLWALGIALGSRTRVVRGEDEAITRVELWPDAEQPVESDGLRALTRGRYYSPRMSPVGVELLPRLQELPPDSYWVGWRYSDLPRLYQDMVLDGWDRSFRGDGDAPPLDPEHTFVLWTKAILVSLVLQTPQGGGAGGEFMFPAL